MVSETQDVLSIYLYIYLDTDLVYLYNSSMSCVANAVAFSNSNFKRCETRAIARRDWTQMEQSRPTRPG